MFIIASHRIWQPIELLVRTEPVLRIINIKILKIRFIFLWVLNLSQVHHQVWNGWKNPHLYVISWESTTLAQQSWFQCCITTIARPQPGPQLFQLIFSINISLDLTAPWFHFWFSGFKTTFVKRELWIFRLIKHKMLQQKNKFDANFISIFVSSFMIWLLYVEKGGLVFGTQHPNLVWMCKNVQFRLFIQRESWFKRLMLQRVSKKICH